MTFASTLRSCFASAGVLALASSVGRGQDQTLRLGDDATGNAGNGDGVEGTISGDGRCIAFSSWTDDLVPGDTNQSSDVFVFDRIAGTLERVSVADDGSQADWGGLSPSISSDGRFVAFTSYATNLGGGSSFFGQVYVRDRVAGTTTLASVDGAGAPGNFHSSSPSISSDGSRVAFHSEAFNLDPADAWGTWDIFVRDLAAGVTITASTTQSGLLGDGHSVTPFLSGDGLHVAFRSFAANFPNSPDDGDAYHYESGAYVKDLDTGLLERVDVDSGGGFPDTDTGPWGITHDGSTVIFLTWTALVPEDDNWGSDAYVRDRTNGVTERVSLATGGGQITGTGNQECTISADGRYVAFLSIGDDATLGDDNGVYDLVLRDRTLGISTVVTRGTLDETFTSYPFLSTWDRFVSDDGSQVVFFTDSPELVSGDANGKSDVFVRSLDRAAAGWVNYGKGWPGTGGTFPTLTPSALPYRGTSLDLDLTNSAGVDTIALLLIGSSRDKLRTRSGATLLVVPQLVIALPLPAAGLGLPVDVPVDYWANDLPIHLQALEVDPGAIGRLSFTDGLTLILGDA